MHDDVKIIEVSPELLIAKCLELRDEHSYAMLIDLCGVDLSSLSTSRRRGSHRFQVVYNLLSLKNNQRLRIKSFAESEPPTIPSVISIWPNANWYEREAFDMFGINFKGHPDLRRILTEYDCKQHPLRKDFKLDGEVKK